MKSYFGLTVTLMMLLQTYFGIHQYIDNPESHTMEIQTHSCLKPKAKQSPEYAWVDIHIAS